MGTNGHEAPKVRITCTRCACVFSVKMPEGQVTNSAKWSSYIVAHERFAACISCGQRFVLGLEQIGVQWGFEPVPEEIANAMEEPSRIILPGPTSGQ